MKKFNFSLDSVLSLEQQAEQLIDIRLSKAKAELDQEISRLNRLQEEIANGRNEFSQAGDIQSMTGWATYRERMNRDRELQVAEIEKRRSAFNQVLLEKIRQQQKIEGLENLKSNELTTHRREQQKQIDKELLGQIMLNRK